MLRACQPTDLLNLLYCSCLTLGARYPAGLFSSIDFSYLMLRACQLDDLLNVINFRSCVMLRAHQTIAHQTNDLFR